MNHIMRMNSLYEINAPNFWSINTYSTAVVEVLGICTGSSTVLSLWSDECTRKLQCKHAGHLQ